MMTWVVVDPDGKLYGPFDDQETAYSWCYKKWPEPDEKRDCKITLKPLMPANLP